MNDYLFLDLDKTTIKSLKVKEYFTFSIILEIDINNLLDSCNTLNTDINDTLHKEKKDRLIESI